MGRGNVCVHGPCEGLYYIDTDDFQVYVSNEAEPETKLLGELDYSMLTGGGWTYDAALSEQGLGDILDSFAERFIQMFPSFSRTGADVWIDRTRRVILENTLFCVAVEDNEWSVAVELLQKEFDGCADLTGFQRRFFKSYLSGMEKCLLEVLPGIGIYTGPWTSARIRREDAARP